MKIRLKQSDKLLVNTSDGLAEIIIRNVGRKYYQVGINAPQKIKIVKKEPRQQKQD